MGGVGYYRDITLEHVFSKQIKSILGNYFFNQDEWLDRQEATDFALFSAVPVSVAVRLRRYEYFKRYPNDFTIRWSRPSGVKTEIDKIREGYADFMLYGFVDEASVRIIKYVLCDLSIFRAREPPPVCVRVNNPPDSELAVFRMAQFPRAFIVKEWQYDQLKGDK